MKTILLNDWKDKDVKEVISEFYDGEYIQRKKDLFVNDEILGIDAIFGSYSYESYDGDAFVLLRKNGELFEVNGSHCSCYGLEGQWKLEKTSKESIQRRIDKDKYLGTDGYKVNLYRNELIDFLKDI